MIPRIFRAHLQVGDFYNGLQQWNDAIREFQAGAKADPKEQTTYLKRITSVYWRKERETKRRPWCMK